MRERLGDVIGCMKVVPERPEDDVIEHDLILVWGTQKRIITRSDPLSGLLRGIATVEPRPSQSPGERFEAGLAGSVFRL
jgi:metal transporter CNNM